MADAPSKADDVARLRRIRWLTKGPGAARHQSPPARPTIEQLRGDVAKAAKKKPLKKRRRK